MSNVDYVREEIVRGLAEAEANLAWLEASAPAHIEAVRDSLLVAFPDMRASIDGATEQVRAGVRDVHAWGTQMASGVRSELIAFGNPDRLREAAKSLHDDVAAPAIALATTVVLSRIPTASRTVYSDGVASESYVRAIDGRDGAISSVATHADAIAAQLRALAAGIESYVSSLYQLVFAFVSLLASTVVAIVGMATAVTVVGLVVAVAEFFGILASAGTFVVTFVNASTKAERERDEALGVFTRDLGAWPAAVL